jgi:hypothetical protein
MLLSDASDSVDGGGGSQSTAAAAAAGDEYVDEEEVENAIASSSPGPGGGKAVPWGKKLIRQLPDEEDDELMMYAKVRPHPPRFSRSPRLMRLDLTAKSSKRSPAARNPHPETPTAKERHKCHDFTPAGGEPVDAKT